MNLEIHKYWFCRQTVGVLPLRHTRLHLIMTMVDDEVEFIPVAAEVFPSTIPDQTIPQFSLNTMYKRCICKKDLRDKLLLQR